MHDASNRIISLFMPIFDIIVITNIKIAIIYCSVVIITIIVIQIQEKLDPKLLISFSSEHALGQKFEIRDKLKLFQYSVRSIKMFQHSFPYQVFCTLLLTIIDKRIYQYPIIITSSSNSIIIFYIHWRIGGGG